MVFNRRKMEDQRRQGAEKEAAARRATDGQVLEDAERLITAWNERRPSECRYFFRPTIGTAIGAPIGPFAVPGLVGLRRSLDPHDAQSGVKVYVDV